jgi:hypothetical protein
VVAQEAGPKVNGLEPNPNFGGFRVNEIHELPFDIAEPPWVKVAFRVTQKPFEASRIVDSNLHVAYPKHRLTEPPDVDQVLGLDRLWGIVGYQEEYQVRFLRRGECYLGISLAFEGCDSWDIRDVQPSPSVGPNITSGSLGTLPD